MVNSWQLRIERESELCHHRGRKTGGKASLEGSGACPAHRWEDEKLQHNMEGAKETVSGCSEVVAGCQDGRKKCCPHSDMAANSVEGESNEIHLKAGTVTWHSQ